MPISTYIPQWEPVWKYIAKFESIIPEDYTGLIGVRLHRTGNPLAIEFFGAELPERTLYPVLVLAYKNGDLVESKEKIETEFDAPWVKFEDFRALCKDVMKYYHEEDALEPIAEKIMETAHADAALLRQAITGNPQQAVRV